MDDLQLKRLYKLREEGKPMRSIDKAILQALDWQINGLPTESQKHQRLLN
jgi:hypothetical protein